MWTKVCGLKTVENALQVSECGVDAIGLNFYSKSKRSVTSEIARNVVEQVPSHVEPIGLFVNHTLDEIHRITSVTGIRTVQLHGDETAEFAAQLKKLSVIRAIRVDSESISALAEELENYQRQGVELRACLIDAKVDGAYGGTSHTAPWDLIANEYDYENWPPLILAGGLSAENVAEAVRIVQPWGVDTASGVESSPGVKDLDLVREFVVGAKSKPIV